MNNPNGMVTREVVTDLWPLYVEGEASADTKALVEVFLEREPEFAGVLRRTSGDNLLNPAAVSLPVDHERRTLLRTQRRRALQSIVVNSVALLASAVMTTIYLWNVVPRFVEMFSGVAVALPAATRFNIVLSNRAVWALPIAAVLTVAAYLLGARFKVPEIVRSGTALAIVTGLVLLLTQAGWLALLNEASTVLGKSYAVAAVNAIETRAILALKSHDYDVAIKHFQTCRQRGENPMIGDWKDQRACTLLLAEAYLAMGDKTNAIALYEEAVQEVRRITPVSEAEREEMARVEKAILSETEAIRR